MTSEFTNAVRQLIQDRGISEELVQSTIEDILLAAYKRKYDTTENAVVRFSDDGQQVALFSLKTIVDEVDDPALEIDLKEALKFNSECELGDELEIEIDPKEFDRVAIQSAKQKARQTLREIQKDTLYSEFKDKKGEMIIGYYQRERNGNIFVDLGKTEGILPKNFQSSRETYRANDRIKALIFDVEKSPKGLKIVLSRSHPEFVKRIFELEVPEIYDNVVEINKIVREPGYRTKIAVSSRRDDIDPVGACVGLKGVRIQAIVRELEGEKIDILKYEIDPKLFIKNALSPAQVSDVVILNDIKKQALAVVPDSQLSLAIGKMGQNVRLANRLVDWNIDVKTEAQFDEMDISIDNKRAVDNLFADDDSPETEITKISELPEVEDRCVEILRENGVELIETLVSLSEEELLAIEGLSEGDIQSLMAILKENVEIVEEEIEKEFDSEESEQEGSEDYEETYECPECGAEITAAMSVCPNCGVGLSFELADDVSDDE